MKVLQINTVCGKGSTGRNCTELASVLTDYGLKCYIAYGQGTTIYPNSFKIGTHFENHLHNLGSRILGNQGYYTRRGTKRLIKYICDLKPDVIHLGNLHGNYLNLRFFFEYLSESTVPVVWTLHDCWAFTGKCAHYTLAKCDKWKTECGRCPIYRQYPPSLFFDRSKTLYNVKKQWFTSVNHMTIVPVSHWLADEVRQSFLGEYPIHPIYNWIDLDIFKSIDQHEQHAIREKYGINRDSFIVLGVSAGWNNGKHDQTAYKLKDFRALQKKLFSHDDIRLVMVGGAKRTTYMPTGSIQVPYVDDVKELAAIFAMADVYVHLSLEDTFGKVIAEAMACGTPAIAYDSTGCSEVVGEGCGYLVEGRNINRVYEAILKIKRDGSSVYSHPCRSFCEDNFNLQQNALAYLNLYKDVL